MNYFNVGQITGYAIWKHVHTSSVERFSENFDHEAVTYLIFFVIFDIGLIRVGASPEFTTVTSTMSRLNFCTYINHCDFGFHLFLMGFYLEFLLF